MKVLLCNIQNMGLLLGSKYLHATLGRNGIESRLLLIPKEGFRLSNFSSKEKQSILDFVDSYKPDIIGFSVASQDFYDARFVTKLIKAHCADIPIIWGGIHASVAAAECLKIADYVFIGESEYAFLDFINALQNKKSVLDIPNLAYINDNNVVINPVRPLNDNLDELPYPGHLPAHCYIMHRERIEPMSRELFREYHKNFGARYSIITTRGCPFNCAYCCNSFYHNLYGQIRVRKRGVDNVIGELRSALKSYKGITSVNIQDDNFFSYDSAWMKDFARKYKRYVDLPFICRSTPLHLTDEKVAALKKAGLYYVNIGLQTGSSRVNSKIYNRHASNEMFLKAAEILRNHNIAAQYDLIVDNPWETEADMLETIDVLLKIPRPYGTQIYSLCFFRGTKLYELRKAKRLPLHNASRKNFQMYRKSQLNEILRIANIMPPSVVRYLVHTRHTWLTRNIIRILHFLVSWILDPIWWVYIIYLAFDKSLKRTWEWFSESAIQGINIIVLRKNI